MLVWMFVAVRLGRTQVAVRSVAVQGVMVCQEAVQRRGCGTLMRCTGRYGRVPTR